MTFLTELKEVLHQNAELRGVFLLTHAKEIIALVEAAEKIADYGCDQATEFDGPCASKIVKIAQEALAALNKEKNG
jgi:hypothetical protein